MEKAQLIKEFISLYGGDESDVRVFASPGRVNLIGEHVDYNGGYVFPAALTMGTTIAVRKRDDRILRMKATDLDDRRIYDRILEVCVPVLFDGENFRKGNAAENIKKAAKILNL